MKCCFFILIIALMMVSGMFPAFAQIQSVRTISYTGVLRDTASIPVGDGYHTVTLSLYQSQYGGVPVCSATRRVEVRNGRFQVQLKVPPSFSYNEVYYVSVWEAGATELAARTVLGSDTDRPVFTGTQDSATVRGAAAPRVVTGTTDSTGVLKVSR